MITRLYLCASVAVVAVSLGAPIIVSGPRAVATGEPRHVSASSRHKAVDSEGAGPFPPDPTSDTGFLGVVVAFQSVELSAQSDGTVESVHVHVGQQVKAGSLIARLDGRAVAGDVAMAEAALHAAAAENDRLTIELRDASDRRARLHQIPDLIPREQVAGAESQEAIVAARLRGAVADLAGKRARRDQLKKMAQNDQIVAPFAGTIAARYVNSGTTVSRSTPIVRVINPSSLVIRFAVPEEQSARLALGRPVTVRIGSVDLMTGGVIESIAPEIDAALRMVVVDARLAVAGRVTPPIPSGTVARVSFPPDAARPKSGRGSSELLGHSPSREGRK